MAGRESAGVRCVGLIRAGEQANHAPNGEVRFWPVVDGVHWGAAGSATVAPPSGSLRLGLAVAGRSSHPAWPLRPCSPPTHFLTVQNAYPGACLAFANPAGPGEAALALAAALILDLDSRQFYAGRLLA